MAADRSPLEWALLPLRRYTDFSGRAPRAEYWWYTLAITLLGLLAEYVDEAIGSMVVGAYGPLSLILELGLFIPGIAVLVRRLHDIDRSGWWALLNLGAYFFVAIAFLAMDPQTLFEQLDVTGSAVLIAVVFAWVFAMIILLLFTVSRGTEGANRFGPDPYGPDQLEEIFA